MRRSRWLCLWDALDAANKGGASLQENRQLERAVQLLLGHTKLESTVRYLGIEDALSISEQVEL